VSWYWRFDGSTLSTSRFWWNCSRCVSTFDTMETPIEPLVLRAALIKAEA
jgi:hypothetical protein